MPADVLQRGKAIEKIVLGFMLEWLSHCSPTAKRFSSTSFISHYLAWPDRQWQEGVSQ
jgi:hypothetical protein